MASGDKLTGGMLIVLGFTYGLIAFAGFREGMNKVPPAASISPTPDGAVKCETDCGLPPLQFQASRTVIVEFKEGEDVKRSCAPNGSLGNVLGCAQGNRIVIENPCSYMARSEPVTGLSPSKEVFIVEKGGFTEGLRGDNWTYRIPTRNVWTRDAEFLWTFTETMCHELGHVNGWSGDHWKTKDLP